MQKLNIATNNAEHNINNYQKKADDLAEVLNEKLKYFSTRQVNTHKVKELSNLIKKTKFSKLPDLIKNCDPTAMNGVVVNQLISKSKM